MRKKDQKQMPLMPSNIEHPRAKELERISQILDSIPTITDMVLQDLNPWGKAQKLWGGRHDCRTGPACHNHQTNGRLQL